ncbi:MAG: hypothetical protein ACPGVP_02480 [Thiolinea sp.]
MAQNTQLQTTPQKKVDQKIAASNLLWENNDMSDLALELLFFLLLATAIGWFIGRFLCKNHEYLERAEKQKLAKQLEALKSEQTQQNVHFNDVSNDLNQHKRLNNELEQENGNLNIQVSKLHTEQKKLLEQVKSLEISHTSLQTLTSDFDANKKKMEGLQIKKINQRGKIEKLEETTQSLSTKLKKTEQYLHTKQEELNRVTKENQQQKTTISELEQERRKLAKLRLDHEELNANLKAQEQEQQNLHANHLELKKEYQQLHSQYEHLQLEGLQANERYKLLNGEKDNALREIEQLKQERQTYLERLRAISNVINIVEPEENIIAANENH